MDFFKFYSLCLVILGLMLSASGVIKGIRVSKIEKQGVKNEATVLEAREGTSKGGKFYELELSVPNSSQDHTVRVTKNIFESSFEVEKILITQLSDEPDKFIVVGNDNPTVRFLLGGGIMQIIGIIFWRKYCRKRTKHKRKYL